jgi:hypothetical protein
MICPVLASTLVPPLGPDLVIIAPPEYVQVPGCPRHRGDIHTERGNWETGGDRERGVICPILASTLVPPLGPDLAVLTHPEYVEMCRINHIFLAFSKIPGLSPLSSIIPASESSFPRRDFADGSEKKD